MATETEVILLDVQFDESIVQGAITSIQGYRNQIDVLKASQKELEAQGQKNSSQYIKQEAEIKTLSTQVRQNQRVVEANSSAQKKQEGYVNQLKKSITELTVQYDRLSKEELENVNVGGKLQKQIKAQSDELKKLKANIGDTRLEVGAYKEGFIEAGKQFNIAGVNVGNALKDIDEVSEKFFGTLITGFNQSTLKAKLFGTTLRTALTVTGIGLLIAAIGTLIAYWDDLIEVMGLAEDKSKSFFKTQQEGIEKNKELLEQYNKELEYQNQLLALQEGKEEDIFNNKRKFALINLNNLKTEQGNLASTINLLFKAVEIEQKRKDLSSITEKEFKEITRVLKESGTTASETLAIMRKQFADVSKEIVNASNALALLSAQQNKFRQDNQTVAAKTDAAITSQDDLTQLKAREDALAKINNAELNATEVHIKILRAGNELKRQEYEKDVRNKQQAEEAKRYAERATLEASKQILAAIAGLFDQATAENKFFALSAIGIDTAQAISALTARSEQNPANAVTFGGAAIEQYAAGIVRILNNIAQAKNLLNFALGGLVPPGLEGFAGGGLTGTRIMSHHGRPVTRANGDNRLATVKVGEVILNQRQQAALGGEMTFRKLGVPGFADGGFVARNLASQVNNNFDATLMTRSFENAMKKVKIFTRITDINKLNDRLTKTQVTSELR